MPRRPIRGRGTAAEPQGEEPVCEKGDVFGRPLWCCMEGGPERTGWRQESTQRPPTGVQARNKWPGRDAGHGDGRGAPCSEGGAVRACGRTVTCAVMESVDDSQGTDLNAWVKVVPLTLVPLEGKTNLPHGTLGSSVC